MIKIYNSKILRGYCIIEKVIDKNNAIVLDLREGKLRYIPIDDLTIIAFIDNPRDIGEFIT